MYRLCFYGLVFFLTAVVARRLNPAKQVLNERGCGKVHASRRIIGGAEALEGQFPWAVYLEISFPAGATRCGGSIVTRYHVVTAAHCTLYAGSGPGEVTVRYGNTDFKKGKPIKVERYLRHQKFVPSTFENDIAIMQLKKPFTFDKKHAVPVCIPSHPVDVFHVPVAVAGWGVTSMKAEGLMKPTADTLQYTLVKVVPNSVCSAAFRDAGFHKELMYCAYRVNADACQGDSGGPMVARTRQGKFLQVGIVSYGIGCAMNDMPGVYTRLDHYYNWIKHHLRRPRSMKLLKGLDPQSFYGLLRTLANTSDEEK
ncbi:trypsin Blo t 3-like [Ornithodoros turicata]|uniref:trypsin Blo t 3-like n=1 Tax=Ornithodoros turicata TaxID=34597 RepID=UPI00313891A0